MDDDEVSFMQPFEHSNSRLLLLVYLRRKRGSLTKARGRWANHGKDCRGLSLMRGKERKRKGKKGRD